MSCDCETLQEIQIKQIEFFQKKKKMERKIAWLETETFERFPNLRVIHIYLYACVYLLLILRREKITAFHTMIKALTTYLSLCCCKVFSY